MHPDVWQAKVGVLREVAVELNREWSEMPTLSLYERNFANREWIYSRKEQLPTQLATESQRRCPIPSQVSQNVKEHGTTVHRASGVIIR
jgi:hypothetical protein